MNCPHCNKPIYTTPAPAWRMVREDQMPPHGVLVDTYSQSAHHWGRAEWNGLNWKVHSGQGEISHWYEETHSQGVEPK